MNDKIVFETDGDHRLAMSFSILSSYLSKLHPNKRFFIDNQKAV
jgi:5-enolpyruvylshikimate-3-phosphate synthase